MKYLLDSNTVSVWARRGSAPLLGRLLEVPPTQLCISSIVEMELWFGIELNPVFRHVGAIRNLLAQLPAVAFGSADARQAAKILALLRQRGTPIGSFDALIAATALAHNLTVITHNTREFSRVPGLQLEDWQ